MAQVKHYELSAAPLSYEEFEQAHVKTTFHLVHDGDSVHSFTYGVDELELTKGPITDMLEFSAPWVWDSIWAVYPDGVWDLLYAVGGTIKRDQKIRASLTYTPPHWGWFPEQDGWPTWGVEEVSLCP